MSGTLDPSSAALAEENERLQRELRARLEEERALRRVATLVAQIVPVAADSPTADRSQILERIARADRRS